jgi:pyruvate-formate lyase-activating enzyme
MSNRVVVIENLQENGPNTARAVAENFGANAWIEAECNGGRVIVKRASGFELPARLGRNMPAPEFYGALLERPDTGDSVLRIHAPNYPLHSRLRSEMSEQFPSQTYDYVLSTGEECALAGYFVERLSRPFMRNLVKRKVKVMPPGYFSGAGMPSSGRHWFSLDLRRFYYEDHFETLFDSPRSLAVNMIGRCNMRCGKCPFHSSEIAADKRKTYGSAMSLERIGIILDKAGDFDRLQSVYPTITGEPLYHPDIVEIVRMIKKRGYACGFTSNGMLLTPKMSEKLLDAGIDSVAFSVDSTQPERYAALQEGGDLAQVEKNLLAFRDLTLKKRGSFAASVNFVVSQKNEDEKEAYRKKWHDLGFTVQFSTYYDLFDNNKPYFNDDGWGPDHRVPCWALWNSLYLTELGTAVSCGSMAKTFGIRENIFSMSAPDLWRCEALNILRSQQLTGVKPGYCKEFTCWTGMINTWTETENGTELKALAFSSSAPAKPSSNGGIVAESRRVVREVGSRAKRVLAHTLGGR